MLTGLHVSMPNWLYDTPDVAAFAVKLCESFVHTENVSLYNIPMRLNKAFSLISLFGWAATVKAQTPNLQAVTTAGNTTTNTISIWNKDGLNIGVDSTVGYTMQTHFLRPSLTENRTMRFDCTANTATGGWEFYNVYSSKSLLYIKQNSGNVGIGTTDPKAKLAVNGDVYARLLRVRPDGWADFVFEPSYQLMSLQELESYINTHKHLPDVPTEEDVRRDGLDLGGNQVILLQKIEELTLHLIDQEKRVNTQKALLSAQEAAFTEQEKRLAELERRLAGQ